LPELANVHPKLRREQLVLRQRGKEREDNLAYQVRGEERVVVAIAVDERNKVDGEERLNQARKWLLI
jgi:hypothetical protein